MARSIRRRLPSLLSQVNPSAYPRWYTRLTQLARGDARLMPRQDMSTYHSQQDFVQLVLEAAVALARQERLDLESAQDAEIVDLYRRARSRARKEARREEDRSGEKLSLTRWGEEGAQQWDIAEEDMSEAEVAERLSQAQRGVVGEAGLYRLLQQVPQPQRFIFELSQIEGAYPGLPSPRGARYTLSEIARLTGLSKKEVERLLADAQRQVMSLGQEP